MMETSHRPKPTYAVFFVLILLFGMLSAASVKLSFDNPTNGRYLMDEQEYTLDGITVLEVREEATMAYQPGYRFAKNTYYERYESEIKEAIVSGKPLSKKYVIAQTDSLNQGTREIVVIVRIVQEGNIISREARSRNKDVIDLSFPSQFNQISEKLYADIRIPAEPLDFQNLVPGKGRQPTQRVQTGWAYTYPEQPKMILTAEKLIYDKQAFSTFNANPETKEYILKTLNAPQRAVKPEKGFTWNGKDASGQFVQSGDYAIQLKATRSGSASDSEMAWPIHVSTNPLTPAQYLLDVSKATTARPVKLRVGNYVLSIKAVAQGGSRLSVSIKDDFGNTIQLKQEGIQILGDNDIVVDGKTTYPAAQQQYAATANSKRLITQEKLQDKMTLRFMFSRPRVDQMPMNLKVTDEVKKAIEKGQYVILTAYQTAWLDVPLSKGFTETTETKGNPATQSESSIVQEGSFSVYRAQDSPDAKKFKSVNPNTILAAFTLNPDVNLKTGGSIHVEMYDNGRRPVSVESLTDKTQPQSGRTYIYTISSKPTAGVHTVSVVLYRPKDGHREELTGSVTVQAAGDARTTTPERPTSPTRPQPAVSSDYCRGYYEKFDYLRARANAEFTDGEARNGDIKIRSAKIYMDGRCIDAQSPCAYGKLNPAGKKACQAGQICCSTESNANFEAPTYPNNYGQIKQVCESSLVQLRTLTQKQLCEGRNALCIWKAKDTCTPKVGATKIVRDKFVKETNYQFGTARLDAIVDGELGLGLLSHCKNKLIDIVCNSNSNYNQPITFSRDASSRQTFNLRLDQVSLCEFKSSGTCGLGDTFTTVVRSS